MENKLKNTYLNITAMFIVVFAVTVGGIIFTVQDATEISREQIEKMSGLERLDFYNENVTSKNNDEYIKKYLRFTLPVGVSKEDLSLTDNYAERILSIVIPNMDEEFIYENPIIGSSTHISDLLYENDGNDLHIEVHLDSVYEHEMFVENNYMYIGFVDPNELYDKIVVIDAGHGGNIPGTAENGIEEADINLGVTKYLKEMLDASNIKAYYTRTTDVNPSFENRVGLANDLNADMFISIHNNASNPGYEFYSGTQVMYNENDSSNKSRTLSELCLNNVVQQLEDKKRDCIEGSSIYIIRKSKVPVALVEIGFITNKEEAKRLADTDYQKRAAAGIYNAIIEAYAEGL